MSCFPLENRYRTRSGLLVLDTISYNGGELVGQTDSIPAFLKDSGTTAANAWHLCHTSSHIRLLLSSPSLIQGSVVQFVPPHLISSRCANAYLFWLPEFLNRAALRIEMHFPSPLIPSSGVLTFPFDFITLEISRSLYYHYVFQYR